MRRLFLLILFPTLLTSCQWTSKDIPNEQVLFKQELEKIDWKKVDTYPFIELCDSILDPIAKRDCFFDFISTHLQTKLNTDTLDGKFNALDTLKILVTIAPDNVVEYKLNQYPDSLKTTIQVIDSLLNAKDNSLPTIYPATKRGIPVRTQFSLDVVLKQQED